MIPKTIHYCWFGGSQLPALALKCMKSWERFCPDYEVVRWDESTFDLSAAPIYVRQAYEAKKWAFVSDYARLQVVYEHGGIYLDTDVELVKSPDSLLGYSAYFGFEDAEHIATGLGFGAEPHAPILAEMLEDYQHLSFVQEDGSLDLTPCPIRNTEMLMRVGLMCDNSFQVLPGNIAVFPTDYFCPLDYYTGVLKKTENTVSIHRYASSWYTEKEKAWYRRTSAALRKELFRERYINRPKQFARKLIGETRYERLKASLTHKKDE